MAISHTDHDHPNTPAARAACRKAMGATGAPGKTSAERALAEAAGIVKKSAKLTVVPRTRGDGGVVKGLKASKSPAGKFIRMQADIPADCPMPLHYAITAAWEKGWDVIEGYKLKVDENRILISGDIAQVSVVWNPVGGCAVFVRKMNSSVTHRADSAQAAIGIAAGDDEWPWVN